MYTLLFIVLLEKYDVHIYNVCADLQRAGVLKHISNIYIYIYIYIYIHIYIYIFEMRYTFP